MSEVKGRVELIGTEGVYARLDDMTFPNPRSPRLDELEWRCRYAAESVDAADLLLAASVIGAYREIIVHKTAKERQYVCSAIKWTGGVHKPEAEK